MAAQGPQTAKPLNPPYPPPGWKRISDFSYDSDLHLVRLKNGIPGVSREAQYIVAKDYTVSFDLDGQRQSITVPKGMLTDLASVPRVFCWIVGRVGPHLEASIVHDYQYVAWQIAGIRPTDDMREFTDELMLVAMKAAGMKFSAHIIYRAVRSWVGRRAFYGKNPKPWVLSAKQVPTCCCQESEPANG